MKNKPKTFNIDFDTIGKEREREFEWDLNEIRKKEQDKIRKEEEKRSKK